jgi:hypothetical protein
MRSAAVLITCAFALCAAKVFWPIPITWMVVLAPFWIPLSIVAAAATVAAAIGLIEMSMEL